MSLGMRFADFNEFERIRFQDQVERKYPKISIEKKFDIEAKKSQDMLGLILIWSWAESIDTLLRVRHLSTHWPRGYLVLRLHRRIWMDLG